MIRFISSVLLASFLGAPALAQAFQTEPGQECMSNALDNNKTCVDISSQLTAGAYAAAKSATAGVLGSGGASVDLAATLSDNAKTKQFAFSNGAQACTILSGKCMAVCESSKARLLELKAQGEAAPPGSPMFELGVMAESDLAKLPEAIRYCTGMSQIASTLEQSATGAAGEAGLGKSVVDALKNNATTIGILGAVGAGAYLLSKGGSGGGGGSGGSTGGSGGTTLTDEQRRIAEAWKDPNCTSSKAASFDHCQKYLTSFCGSLANVEDVRCQAFTDKYCGLGESTNSTDAPMGLNTQLCKDAIATRFCKMADTSNCRSCLNLKDRKSAACVGRPDVCNREPTEKEMAYFKGTCPMDPVFTDPKWASVVPSTSTSTSSTSTTTTSTTTPTGDDKTASTTLNGKGRLPANINSKFGAPVGTASLSATVSATEPAPDVAQAFGPGVFDNASLALQEVCKRAWLNGCGPRMKNY